VVTDAVIDYYVREEQLTWITTMVENNPELLIRLRFSGSR